MESPQSATTYILCADGSRLRSCSPALCLMKLDDVRSEYRRDRLRKQDLAPDPVNQFLAWLEEAFQEGVIEPTAMSLATSSRDGFTLMRTVLLKGIDQRGFVFYTNLKSRKALQINENPQVSLLFPWLALERQVLITGTAERLPLKESLEYFSSRPRESQLSAWASHQSEPISSREALEMIWANMKDKFAHGKVPLPSFWGGYRIQPKTIEFWQGGKMRLHDRFEYFKAKDRTWQIRRLSP